MSNTNKMELLFQELCDEDIAYISGGVTTTATASVSDQPNKTTAMVTLDGGDGKPQTLTLTSPTPTQQSALSSVLSGKLLFSVPVINSQLISVLVPLS